MRLDSMTANLSVSSPDQPADSQISHHDALVYWNSIEPNVDGMLGGLPQVHKVDVQGSTAFLAKLRRKDTASLRPLTRVVDCGAGIGRITKALLSKVAQVVDIVEPVKSFTSEITTGADFAEVRTRNGIGKIYNVGLEDWVATEVYDVFWNQWCLGQLTDKQLTTYLFRCTGKLATGGWIIVKENMSTDPYGHDIFDPTDSSVTRSDASFRSIFESVGLNIVATELQRGPSLLLNVMSRPPMTLTGSQVFPVDSTLCDLMPCDQPCFHGPRIPPRECKDLMLPTSSRPSHPLRCLP